MNFYKNISNELNQNKFIDFKSKLDLVDFVGKDTIDYWYRITSKPYLQKILEPDIFKINADAITFFSNAVEKQISQLLLININTGKVFPYHENNYINFTKETKFYFCQISNRGWGHAVWINNHSLYNIDNGDVFVFESQKIEIGAGNSGWEPLKFLIGW